MNHKKQKIHNKQDWRDFAIGYFRVTNLLCSEMIESRYETENFNIETLYIPALFNLKHGIEILIKALGIEFLKKDTLDASDYLHDIEELFLKLRREVTEERLVRAIKSYNERDSSSGGYIIEKSPLDKLENLVKKYQNLDFIKEKIDIDYVIKDEDNTAFKYPTNSLRIQINYENVAKRFTLEDVRETQLDSLKIETILWQFYILIYEENNK